MSCTVHSDGKGGALPHGQARSGSNISCAHATRVLWAPKWNITACENLARGMAHGPYLMSRSVRRRSRNAPGTVSPEGEHPALAGTLLQLEFGHFAPLHDRAVRHGRSSQVSAHHTRPPIASRASPPA